MFSDCDILSCYKEMHSLNVKKVHLKGSIRKIIRHLLDYLSNKCLIYLSFLSRFFIIIGSFLKSRAFYLSVHYQFGCAGAIDGRDMYGIQSCRQARYIDSLGFFAIFFL